MFSFQRRPHTPPKGPVRSIHHVFGAVQCTLSLALMSCKSPIINVPVFGSPTVVWGILVPRFYQNSSYNHVIGNRSLFSATCSKNSIRENPWNAHFKDHVSHSKMAKENTPRLCVVGFSLAHFCTDAFPFVPWDCSLIPWLFLAIQGFAKTKIEALDIAATIKADIFLFQSSIQRS
jgi:hypothetical protein